jgi:hypothetical protein
LDSKIPSVGGCADSLKDTSFQNGKYEICSKVY